jgi:hypothetical protein
MTLHLSLDELAEITSKRRPKKICEALALMGVEFKLRPDGFPLVGRLYYETVFLAGRQADKMKHRPVPNWEYANG